MPKDESRLKAFSKHALTHFLPAALVGSFPLLPSFFNGRLMDALAHRDWTSFDNLEYLWTYSLVAFAGVAVAGQIANNQLKLRLRFKMAKHLLARMTPKILANMDRVPAALDGQQSHQIAEQDTLLFPEKLANMFYSLEKNAVGAIAMTGAIIATSPSWSITATSLLASAGLAGAVSAFVYFINRKTGLRHRDNRYQGDSANFRDAAQAMFSQGGWFSLNGDFSVCDYLERSFGAAQQSQARLLIANTLSNIGETLVTLGSLSVVGALPLLPFLRSGELSVQAFFEIAVTSGFLIQNLNLSREYAAFMEASASAGRAITLTQKLDAAEKQASDRSVLPVSYSPEGSMTIGAAEGFTVRMPATNTPLFIIEAPIEIPPGAVFTLQGDNGTGKSVLIRDIFYENLLFRLGRKTGEDRPALVHCAANSPWLPGNQHMNGTDELKRQLALVHGSPSDAYTSDHFNASLRLAGLESPEPEKLSTLEHYSQKPPDRHSLGIQSRLKIARALLPRLAGDRDAPFILFLDEAFTNIDENNGGIGGLISRIGETFPSATIFIVQHGVDIKCSHRAEIANGVLRRLPPNTSDATVTIGRQSIYLPRPAPP